MFMTVSALPAVSASRVDWRPYLVGVGIGVLSWAVFVIVAKPIGITTALSQLSGGLAVPLIGAEAVAKNAYWARHALSLDYGVLFLVGVFFGALVSALAAGSWRIEFVPEAWRTRFGGCAMRRSMAAFVGGMLVMFGARLADGCTSGNGISQGLQLALVGWIFLAVMFTTGIGTAFVLFRRSR
jgi:hypothetical protein